MFVKVTRRRYKGKIYEQASIVETMREDGKIKHKQIQNLGSIKTNHDRIKIKNLLNQIKKGKELITLDEVNEFALEYGVGIIVKQLWDGLEIDSCLSTSKATYDLNQLIYVLITHRLHNYGSENLSEREALRWIKEESYSNLDVELRQVYRGIKILLNKKEEIEKHLCMKLHKNSEVVFYDLTSSYVEGLYEDSEIVNYGYSRDKKIGKKQIILGLLISDGLPVAHKVWEGNTQDRTTLKDAVGQLKKLGIKKFIFVADRGLITEPNLEWLENQKLEYIIATKRRRETLVKELMNKKISENEEIKKVHVEKKGDNYRVYYLCYNKKLAKQKIKELKELKKKLIKKIKEIKKPTEHKVLEALGKNKRIFNLSFKKGFTYSINKEAYEYEKKIAGRYILVTNNQSPSKKDILKTYKQLMEIERCFRQLKHFGDMRPIFHKTDDGIRAHVFIAVLTLLIEKLINKKIPEMTTREVVTEMKKLKLSKAGKYLVRTNLTPIQRKILSQIGLEAPTKVL
ncbi:MAG: IS1634 family transposase [archaeon]